MPKKSTVFASAAKRSNLQKSTVFASEAQQSPEKYCLCERSEAQRSNLQKSTVFARNEVTKQSPEFMRYIENICHLL